MFDNGTVFDVHGVTVKVVGKTEGGRILVQAVSTGFLTDFSPGYITEVLDTEKK